MKNSRTCLTQNLLPTHSLLAVIAGCGLGVLALAPAAHAQTDYVSIGSGVLSDSTIWNPNGVPGTNDTIEVAAGTAVTNTVSQAAVGPVTIDTGGTFALNASMTVETITNNGTLNLNANSSGRTLTLNGNFANYGSVTTSSSSGLDTIQFVNTNAPALWLGSGDLSGSKCQFLVGADATLDISGLASPVKFRPTGTMVSTITGTLIAGEQILDGNNNASCSFKLAAGGTLVTANPNGIVNGTTGTLNFAKASTFDPAGNYVFNGTSTQVTTGLPDTANNLTVTNAAGVTLSAATAISGTLALNAGVLTTTSGATPTAAAATSQAGSYVSGPLALVYDSAGSQTFPVGKGGNERAVTLNYSALTGSSTVTVEQFESAMGGTVPPGTTQFGARYWTVSQTGGSGLTYNLTVDGTGFTSAGTPVLLQQGTLDTSYSTTFASPNYTASGLTTFGNFTLGNYVPSANQLAFTTGAQTLTAGVTSGTITVQLQNSGGTPLNTTSNLTVNLTTTSGGGVFRDASDTVTITSVTITTGNNSASFKYKDTAAPATPTLTASASGANPATQFETVNPAAASQLAFTTQPASTNLAAILDPVVVQVQDQYGNPVAQSGTAITLTLNNGGASVLTGTMPQNTDGSGAATFSDLAVATAPGLGLTLTATGGGLTPANSASFNITPRVIVKALNNTALDQDASWTGGVQPGVNDLAQINDSSVSSTVSSPDVGVGVSWYGLSVTGWSASHGYTINDFNGYDFITLGAGGLTGSNVTHTIAFNCPLTLAVDQVWDWSGNSGTLTFNNAVDTAGHQLILGGNQSINVTSSGSITGAGDLIKQGSDTVTLGGYQDYTGTTVVSNGTLLVSGTISSSSSITVAGGTLTGNGYIYSPVTVQSGGTFAPGGGLTTLYLGNDLTLSAGSQTQVAVNRDTLGSDQVSGINQVNYGGTLVVNNAASTPSQEGDTFTLFSATTVNGNFSGISGSPGAGLAWSFDPATGVLSVVAGGTATNPTNITATVSGNVLTLTWPADHLGWVLQGQTNSLATGLGNNWVDVPGSDASTTNVMTINPANPTVFFRLRLPQ